MVAPIANESFDNANSLDSLSVAVGVLAFGLQIYGDFAGYSNIARGSARLLGVELVHNFSEPYLSRNITEFWRRWHISLSSWLKDYLYISLGGNRAGTRKTYRNLMLTMLLGGLWHGAGWNFVIWGGLHGLFLAAHRLLRPQASRVVSDRVAVRDIPAILITFAAVSFAWIFFRAQSASQAWDVITSILSLQGGRRLMTDDLALVLLATVATILVDLALRRRITAGDRVERRPVLSGLIAGVMLLSVLVFSGGDPVPFIYFQF